MAQVSKSLEIDNLYKILLAPVTFLVLLEFTVLNYYYTVVTQHPDLGTSIGGLTPLTGADSAILSGGMVALSLFFYILGFFNQGSRGYDLRLFAMFWLLFALFYSSAFAILGLVIGIGDDLFSGTISTLAETLVLIAIPGFITLLIRHQVNKKVA